MLFYILISGLWALWVKGRAVDNGFIVIHGKRPGSPQANYPQVHSLFAGTQAVVGRTNGASLALTRS